MDLDRYKKSLHDAIFVYGIIGIIATYLFMAGYIGGTFNWIGSEKIMAANYEYTGTIDKQGKYHGK